MYSAVYTTLQYFSFRSSVLSLFSCHWRDLLASLILHIIDIMLIFPALSAISCCFVFVWKMSPLLGSMKNGQNENHDIMIISYSTISSNTQGQIHCHGHENKLLPTEVPLASKVLDRRGWNRQSR